MFLKKKTNSQVERIKVKLMKVKEKDPNYSVFGSEKFEYKLNPVISMEEVENAEKRLGVRFPESFRIFLTQLGNGGTGPYHGVYNLDFIIRCNEHHNNEKKTCCLYPDMSKEYWNELIKPLDDDISDEDYFMCEAKLHGGLLEFGTQGYEQGFEYDMYLVVTGKHVGRIVYIYTNEPSKDYPFSFTHEDNFLDWYERWLDEILLGYDTSWFGYVMGGDEFHLLHLYNNSNDQQSKINALKGFYKFRHISDSSFKILEHIAVENFETNEEITIVATSALERLDFNRSKNLLRKLLNSNNEKYIELAVKIINIEKNLDIGDFSDEILKLLNSGNEEYNNYAIRILSRHIELDISQFKDAILNVFYNKKDESFSWEIAKLICKFELNSYDIFGEWLQSSSKKMINNALFSLKDIPYDKSYFETIKNLLLINDDEINEKILTYLGVIEDERLLLYYKNIWNKYCAYNLEADSNYIQSFKTALSNLNYPLDYFESDGLLIELLREFNINLQNENIIQIVNVSCIKNLERVFIIYFLKDKSKCIASYDYNGNFIFEIQLEDMKVPMYFMYDFTNVYVGALESTGNINERTHVPGYHIFTVDLDNRELTNIRRSVLGHDLFESERRLIKLTL